MSTKEFLEKERQAEINLMRDMSTQIMAGLAVNFFHKDSTQSIEETVSYAVQMAARLLDKLTEIEEKMP